MTENERREKYIRREKRTCDKKNRHITQESARESGRRRISAGGVGGLWVYQCVFCQGWHLTRNDLGPPWAVHFTLTRAA